MTLPGSSPLALGQMERNEKTANGNALLSVTFERIPSDYAILKIIQVSEDADGDTLWGIRI